MAMNGGYLRINIFYVNLKRRQNFYPPAQKIPCMHGDECAKSSASDEMSPLAGAQDGPRRSPTGEGGFQGAAGMPARLHK
ncbi:MAG: hypothetical protein A2Z83_03795 [Omnitrophica bacterium GWA2_52_8]|nr:MAG: hypothetical protein A2Z83_03795 [Omnitrophica bacterium GWA2_52_8]